jgi:hypothetical protein
MRDHRHGTTTAEGITMSNRHQRRTDLRSFKREAHNAHLVTYLVDADAPLDDHPLLCRALSYWRSNIQQRRPFCPACNANFADDARAAAFLFAMPSLAPTSASVTAFCDQCWNALPPDAVQREATKVLRQLIPNGRFLDAP